MHVSMQELRKRIKRNKMFISDWSGISLCGEIQNRKIND